MAKMLKIDQRQQVNYCYTLHQALVLLNKYVIKRGLKRSLLDQDRFMVALACYFISSKANSQFLHSHKFIEFYFHNRPMGEGAENGSSAPASSVAGMHGSPSHAFASP